MTLTGLTRVVAGDASGCGRREWREIVGLFVVEADVDAVGVGL